jgi:hypothetical protein
MLRDIASRGVDHHLRKTSPTKDLVFWVLGSPQYLHVSTKPLYFPTPSSYMGGAEGWRGGGAGRMGGDGRGAREWRGGGASEMGWQEEWKGFGGEGSYGNCPRLPQPCFFVLSFEFVFFVVFFLILSLNLFFLSLVFLNIFSPFRMCVFSFYKNVDML